MEHQRGEVVLKVDALVDALAEYCPSEAKRLRNDPDFTEIMKAGRLGGKKKGTQDGGAHEANEAQDANAPELRKLVKLVRVTLPPSIKRAEYLCEYVTVRLKVARRMSLSGSLLAGAASAGVLSSLKFQAPTVVQAFGATLALAGSIAASLSHFILHDTAGRKQRPLTDLMGELLKFVDEASKLLAEFRIMEATTMSRSALEKLILKATEAAGTLGEIDFALGRPGLPRVRYKVAQGAR
jgi:hypothetical protein